MSGWDLDRVSRGFGDVLASRGQDPPDLAAGQLLDLPSGILLGSMVVPAGRIPIAQTRTATGIIRNVILEITVHGRSPAAGAGACRVPDLGQVPEHHAGIMPLCLGLVVARVRGDRADRDEQVPLARDPGGEPPAPVAARRAGLIDAGEGKPGSGRRADQARRIWPVCVVWRCRRRALAGRSRGRWRAPGCR